jgi:hypothetical protein
VTSTKLRLRVAPQGQLYLTMVSSFRAKGIKEERLVAELIGVAM